MMQLVWNPIWYFLDSVFRTLTLKQQNRYIKIHAKNFNFIVLGKQKPRMLLDAHQLKNNWINYGTTVTITGIRFLLGDKGKCCDKIWSKTDELQSTVYDSIFTGEKNYLMYEYMFAHLFFYGERKRGWAVSRKTMNLFYINLHIVWNTIIRSFPVVFFFKAKAKEEVSIVFFLHFTFMSDKHLCKKYEGDSLIKTYFEVRSRSLLRFICNLLNSLYSLQTVPLKLGPAD